MISFLIVLFVAIFLFIVFLFSIAELEDDIAKYCILSCAFFVFWLVAGICNYSEGEIITKEVYPIYTIIIDDRPYTFYHKDDQLYKVKNLPPYLDDYNYKLKYTRTDRNGCGIDFIDLEEWEYVEND